MSDKFCEYCNKIIVFGSTQDFQKRFCKRSCQQMSHRRKKGNSLRQIQRLNNLPVNKEWLYIARECKRAGSVQVMSMHTVESLRQLVQLICEHPKGTMEINHVEPANGKDRIGLLHPINVFYGGRAQNRKYGNNCSEGAGLSISRLELEDKWSVPPNMSDKNILELLAIFLGDTLVKYVNIYPVNKSARMKLIDSIIELDRTGRYTRDNLASMQSYGLSSIKAEQCGVQLRGFYFPSARNKSKVLIYLQELARFADIASSVRAENCEFLKDIFLAGASALSKARYQPELIEIFTLYGPSAIRHQNRYMKSNGKAAYSKFKDFLYLQTADCLVGKGINEDVLRNTLDKYTETRKQYCEFCISSINLIGCYEYYLEDH